MADLEIEARDLKNLCEEWLRLKHGLDGPQVPGCQCHLCDFARSVLRSLDGKDPE